MRIEFNLASPTIASTLRGLERARHAVLLVLSLAFSFQAISALLMWPNANARLRLALGLQFGLLVLFVGQLLRRRSLAWQTEQIVRELIPGRVTWNLPAMRLPPSLASIAGWLGATVLFTSTLFLLVRAGTLNARSFYSGLIGALPNIFNSGEHFSSAWQVQASVLGVFVALIAIVFQLVSLRIAFESDLLPVLVRRSKLKEIVIANLLLLLAAAVLQSHTADEFARWFLGLGFAFSIMSASFLVVRLLKVLTPTAIYSLLAETIRLDVRQQRKSELFHNVALGVLQRECQLLNIEHEYGDLHGHLTAVRASRSGKIADFDLVSLRRFAATLGSGADTKPRAYIHVQIGSRVEKHDVIARIPGDPNVQAATKLVHKVLRIVPE